MRARSIPRRFLRLVFTCASFFFVLSPALQAGTPVKGDRAAIVRLQIEPASVSAGEHPVIRGTIQNRSVDAAGKARPATLDVRVALKYPDGKVYSSWWNDMRFKANKRLRFTKKSTFATDQEGQYTVTFYVYTATRKRLMAKKSGTFEIKAIAVVEDDEEETWIEQGTEDPVELVVGSELYVDFRITDVFDDPPLNPGLGPPPNQLYSVGYATSLSAQDWLFVSVEWLTFDDPVTTNWGWGNLGWNRMLESGTNFGVDISLSFDEDGNLGWSLGGDIASKWGENFDYKLRMSIIESTSGIAGWRFEGKAMAVLTKETALKSRLRYFVNEDRQWDFMLETKLAYYLGNDTAMHGLVRISLGEELIQIIDPFSGLVSDLVAEKESYVASVEIRHQFNEDVLGRIGYLGFAGRSGINEGLIAHGIHLGAEVAIAPDTTIRVYYRYYFTNENLGANSLSIGATYQF